MRDWKEISKELKPVLAEAEKVKQEDWKQWCKDNPEKEELLAEALVVGLHKIFSTTLQELDELEENTQK